MYKIHISTLFIVSALSGNAFAQNDGPDAEFNLFEQVETPNDNPRGTTDSPVRGPQPRNTTTPDFTLVGTGRIGSSNHVILKHRSGTSVRVKVEQERNAQVPGYLDYRIIDFQAGEVSLRLPETTSCSESELLGVKCSAADNIAILTLANGEPLESTIRQTTSPNESGENQSNEVSTNEPPDNPFNAVREQREGNATNRAQSTSRFTPRRIPPEDVPDGMRVVSTPFGDRLVEE